MRERDHLIGIVQSLTEVLEASRTRPMLNQLVGMALLEASECLVREGSESAELNQLGVGEELAYFLDAKYRAGPEGRVRAGNTARSGPHLRLVGS